MNTKKTTNKFSAEVRERAVQMVRDHQGDHASQWAAIASIASKIGCTAESLMRPGATTAKGSMRITTKAPGYNGIMAPGIPE